MRPADQCPHTYTRPLTPDDQRPLCTGCGAVYTQAGWVR